MVSSTVTGPMAGPKIERLVAGGSLHIPSHGSNAELVLWIFVLAASLLALAYWGS